jgi:hypothetical protein
LKAASRAKATTPEVYGRCGAPPDEGLAQPALAIRGEQPVFEGGLVSARRRDREHTRFLLDDHQVDVLEQNAAASPTRARRLAVFSPDRTRPQEVSAFDRLSTRETAAPLRRTRPAASRPRAVEWVKSHASCRTQHGPARSGRTRVPGVPSFDLASFKRRRRVHLPDRQ